MLSIIASAVSGALAYIQWDRSHSDHRTGKTERGHSTQEPGLFQLPPQIADFGDREDELKELFNLLRLSTRKRGVPFPLVIFGPSGVGKTTLALRLAHGQHEKFPDAQLYVDLRGSEVQPSDPGNVLFGLLRDLGLSDKLIPQRMEERARLFRAKITRLRVLLMLDNAASEAQVRPLLPGHSDSAVLITSRGPLSALEGARRLQLSALEPPQALGLFKNFVGDARTEAEPQAASEIVRLCGYLPLAMRIAGARAAVRPTSPLAEHAERLRDEKGRLDELKVGDLEVRASLRVSYVGCSPQERQAFHLLGELNAPTFSDWAVAALAQISLRGGRSLTERLMDAQLLEVAGKDPTGTSAYRLQDLTRLFARELSVIKTSDVERREALESYFGIALEHASRADLAVGYDHPRCPYVRDTALRLGTDATLVAASAEPLRWFMAKSTELINAVEAAYEVQSWEYVWRLAVSTAGYFWLRGQLHDWERTHDLGLDAARRQGTLAGEAYILSNQGELYRRQRRWDESRDSLHRAIELFRGLGYTLEEAQTVHALGVWCEKREHWQDSLQHYNQALKLFQTLEHRLGQAYSLISLGFVCRRRHLMDEARDYFRQAESMARNAGDPLAEANALRGTADVLREQGAWTEALEWYNRCLPVVRELGDRRAEAYALLYIAQISLVLRRTRDVSQQLDHCLSSFQTLGDRVGEAHTYFALAELHQRRRRFGKATDHYRSSLELYRELGYVKRQRKALAALADVLVHQGRKRESELVREELRAISDDRA